MKTATRFRSSEPTSLSNHSILSFKRILEIPLKTTNKIKHVDMMREFTATYSNGVFKPAVPLDIEDGSTVVLSVADSPSSVQNADLFEASAGSWADLVDGEKLIDDIYASRAVVSKRVPKF